MTAVSVRLLTVATILLSWCAASILLLAVWALLHRSGWRIRDCASDPPAPAPVETARTLPMHIIDARIDAIVAAEAELSRRRHPTGGGGA